MISNRDGIVEITDGRSGIRLRHVLKTQEGYYQTSIEVWAGTFSGSRFDNLAQLNFNFLSELRALYKTLAGSAALQGLEGFELVLTGNGRGQIKVVAKISDWVGEGYLRMSFAFEIDQTFLPDIIKQFELFF